MIYSFTGVLLDGSAPVVQKPIAQEWDLPQGVDARVNMVVVNSAGAAVDISAGSLVLTGRKNLSDNPPPLSRLGVLDNGPGGLAHFIIIPGDTITIPPATPPAFPLDTGANWWGVDYLDGSGLRHQIIPLGLLRILPPSSLPGATTTAPTVGSGLGYTNEGRAVFAAVSSVTVTMALAHANTTYRVYTGVDVEDAGAPVSVTYTPLSTTQFQLNASTPFTGAVSWGTRP